MGLIGRIRRIRPIKLVTSSHDRRPNRTALHCALGRYAYAHGPAIAHDGAYPERESYEQVVLVGGIQGISRSFA